jgi:hypothetical protein
VSEILGPAALGGHGDAGQAQWYIVAVGVSGLLALVVLVPTIDPDRVRQVAGAIALFAGFVIGGELVSIRLQRNNRVKDLAVTTTFAYGLVPLAGTAVAVLVFMFASSWPTWAAGSRPTRRCSTPPSACSRSPPAGLIYHALGGGYEITTATLRPWPPAGWPSWWSTTCW